MKQPRTLPISQRSAVVIEDFSFTFKGYEITIKAEEEFVYDGASIPRLGWTLTGMIPFGYIEAAAVIHDYLYYKEGWLLGAIRYTRKEADEYFLECIKELGYNKRQIWIAKNYLKYLGNVKWKEKY